MIKILSNVGEIGRYQTSLLSTILGSCRSKTINLVLGKYDPQQKIKKLLCVKLSLVLLHVAGYLVLASRIIKVYSHIISHSNSFAVIRYNLEK